jgi:hypothetical protein
VKHFRVLEWCHFVLMAKWISHLQRRTIVPQDGCLYYCPSITKCGIKHWVSLY